MTSAAAIDAAAASLRETCCAFTRRNLYHAVRRLARTAIDFDGFVAGPLARRLRAAPIDGLLPRARSPASTRLPREWDAYFPAAILIVDRRELVDLFAASGVLVHARMAVVSCDGTPRAVVSWLRRGFTTGFRAPIGYLHDAATVMYPFALEPLQTLTDALGDRESIAFRDLGLPPAGLPASELRFCAGFDEPIRELEAPPPAAIVAYAARRLAAMQPRDPWLAPLTRSA